MSHGSAHRAQEGFHAAFGRAPRWIASAPGRVNLIGEFTDFNDGYVLPMAIELRTAIAAASNETDRVNVRSEARAERGSLSLSKPIKADSDRSWLNYPKGVIAAFQRRAKALSGFDAFVSSDVPIGAGLSSSASLTVATAALLEAITGMSRDPLEKALLCQRAEHEFAGVPCGIMDPFISIRARAGHLLLLDCASNEPTWIPLAEDSVAILVVNTGVKHDLAAGAYAARRDLCERAARALGVRTLRQATLEALQGQSENLSADAMRCARHVISENARVLEAAQAARIGDWRHMGELMYLSHASLREDYQVSCRELDALVAIAQELGAESGVYGCRMTGGGFGGCTVALVEAARAPQVAERFRALYRDRIGATADAYLFAPAAGACWELTNV